MPQYHSISCLAMFCCSGQYTGCRPQPYLYICKIIEMRTFSDIMLISLKFKLFVILRYQPQPSSNEADRQADRQEGRRFDSYKRTSAMRLMNKTLTCVVGNLPAWTNANHGSVDGNNTNAMSSLGQVFRMTECSGT